MVHSIRLVRVALAALLLVVPVVSEAGPPLICRPFQTGSAEVLPWGDGSGWNTPDRHYDLQRLTRDTLRLVSSGAPVLVRMENLRRATIYAAQDPRIAGELLSAILARALQPAANGAPDADALFDAGYLIESYKQAAWLDRQHARSEDRGAWWMGSQPAADGYALVTRASTLGGSAPEMEFAASLMKDGTVADEHRRRASAGASTDSLLARNLESHEK
jgi:hypothetical protein